MQTNSKESLDIFHNLDDIIQDSFPFYIPGYFNLPKDYPSLSGDMNTPIEVANFIYERLFSANNVHMNSQHSLLNENEITWGQVGAGITNRPFKNIYIDRNVINTSPPFTLK